MTSEMRQHELDLARIQADADVRKATEARIEADLKQAQIKSDADKAMAKIKADAETEQAQINLDRARVDLELANAKDPNLCENDFGCLLVHATSYAKLHGCRALD